MDSPLRSAGSPAAARGEKISDSAVRRGTPPLGSAVRRRSVLVLDGMEETREVLRTALERNGTRVLAAGTADEGLRLARTHRPDVIVVDIEMDRLDPEEISPGSDGSTPPYVVMLGTCPRPPAEGGAYLAKPFRYAALIEQLERLLTAEKPPAAVVRGPVRDERRTVVRFGAEIAGDG